MYIFECCRNKVLQFLKKNLPTTEYQFLNTGHDIRQSFEVEMFIKLFEHVNNLSRL